MSRSRTGLQASSRGTDIGEAGLMLMVQEVRGMAAHDICSAVIDRPAPAVDECLARIGRGGRIALKGQATASTEAIARVHIYRVDMINGPLARRDCRRGRAGTTTRRRRAAPTGQRRPRALRADRRQRTDRRPPEGRPPRRRPGRGLRDHQPRRRARQQAVLHSGRTPSG